VQADPHAAEEAEGGDAVKLRMESLDSYEGKVGSCRVVIARHEKRFWSDRGVCHGWGVSVFETPDVARRGMVCMTLEEAKATAAKVWIQLQLDGLHGLVKGTVPRGEFNEFHKLCRGARAGRNPLDVPALHGWLCDHGRPDDLPRKIVTPGNKAKLVWPAWWRDFAQALQAKQ
jgi:hypothetical protein